MPSVGLSTPGTTPDRDPRTSIEFAQRAEATAAYSVWAPERIVCSTPDVFVTLGAATASLV